MQLHQFGVVEKKQLPVYALALYELMQINRIRIRMMPMHQAMVTGATGVNIGNQIKTLRAERGWTQGVLAAKLGVNQGTISRWESGDVEPMGLYASMVQKLLAQKPRRRGAE